MISGLQRCFVAFALCVACKIEPVGQIESGPEPVVAERWFSLWEPEVFVDEEASMIEAELRHQMVLLTNAALEGRRPGTKGASLTALHLERAMQGIGLSPAGVGGGWRQPVVVRIRTTADGQVELLSAAGEGEVLRHGKGVVMQRAEAAGIWSDTLVVVDGGWGITATDLDHDDYAALEVKGRVVLIRAGVPDTTAFTDGAGAKYGEMDAKLARARALGAQGVLIATGALQAETAWEQHVADYQRPRIVAGEHVDDETRPPPFVALLSAEAEASTRAWLAAVLAVDGGVPKLSASVTTTERTVVDPNIVGRIPGSERPREVIVVLAHWDAGGTTAPLLEGGAAIDNATGVAAMLATARKSTDWVRRGRLPARTIAFVATASDSLDLAGTRALLASGPLRRSDIIAVVTLDTLSVHPGGATLGGLGVRASTLGSRLQRLRPSLRVVETEGGGGPITPSHQVALDAGTPAVTLTRYDRDADAQDTYDANGPVDDLRDDVSLIFDLVWSYAESEDRPTLEVSDG